MKSIKHLALTLLLALAAPALFGQNGTMSPYSNFGYGLLRDHTTGAQRSMGGVGYAMNSGRQINAMNPASYAAIDTLTFIFDMGLDLTYMKQNELVDGTTAKDDNFGGGLDYANMQFPLGKYMGGSVGLLPFSSVGYSFGSSVDNGTVSYQGNGSINQLYLGVAGRPFKGFTVGANVSYLFGTVINDVYGYVTSTGNNSLFQSQIEVRDYYLNFGVQYSFTPIANNRATLGLTYAPSKTLHGNARQIFYDTAVDTQPSVEDEHKLADGYSLPETWGAGINWEWDRKLMVEFDYTYQPWSKARFRGFANDPTDHTFANRTKYALGAQYTPNYRGGYFKRMDYRIGAYTTQEYLIVRGNNVREHGVSVGFGFPVPEFKTRINLGFEWKHRQGHPNPLLKEDYFSVTLGINFNEMWFFQRKLR